MMVDPRRIAIVYFLSTFGILSMLILQTLFSPFHQEPYSADTRAAIEHLLNNFDKVRVRGDINIIEDQENIWKRESCRPQENVVLLKTHKTGSSTLQNIIYRYGDRNSLTFALPLFDNYFGTPYLFKEAYVMKVQNVRRYNILANHARYRKEALMKMMPLDTIYITSLRHPARQFESLYKYYQFSNRFHQSIEVFAQNPEKYYRENQLRKGGKKQKQAAINPMLYDLGLEKKDLRNWSKIRLKLEEIEQNFGLVVISEYFDESLILLRDLLCWSLEDVAYIKLNARVEDQVEYLSAEMEKNLTDWNSGDMALYRYFNKTFWKKVRRYGLIEMRNEIEELHKVIDKVKQTCLDDNSVLQFVGLRTVVLRYEVKSGLDPEQDYLCTSFIRTPQQYLTILRRKMKNRVYVPNRFTFKR